MGNINVIFFAGKFLVCEIIFFFDTDAAAGAAAAAAAASAVCTLYVVIGGRFAPPHKNVGKYIQQKQQQKQQRQQHQNLFCQFIQLNIHLLVDVKGLNIRPTP